MDGIRVAHTPVTGLDESVEIEGVGVAQLAVDRAHTPVDDGAPEHPGNRGCHVWEQHFGRVGGDAPTPVAVDDAPQIETDERLVIRLEGWELCLRVKVGRERLQQHVDERRRPVLGGAVGCVRGGPHADVRIAELRQRQRAVV